MKVYKCDTCKVEQPKEDLLKPKLSFVSLDGKVNYRTVGIVPINGAQVEHICKSCVDRRYGISNRPRTSRRNR